MAERAEAADRRYLRRALSLALHGRYRTAPNPRVGAVLVRDGDVVGEGWHREVGCAHAEVEAFAAAGDRARGATLYVTLEPCSHFGRTSPCADAVIAAGVARVVAAVGDPDPRVAGRGFERLRAAGIAVEVGLLAEEAVAINLGFFVPHRLARPAVTLKWAMSLDGKIATASGESRWISSPAARRSNLALREEHDAILCGVGTVLADDPRLDRRIGRARGPNLRVILDRRLRTRPSAALFTVPGPIVVYAESGDRARAADLAAVGAEVVALPTVEPQAVLDDLFRREIRSVLVEGGGEIHASFAEAGLFDAVHIDAAPLLIGGRGAPGPLGGGGIQRLVEATRLERLVVSRAGGDLKISGFAAGRLEQLVAGGG